MGDPTEAAPVQLVVALFSRHAEVLDTAEDRLQAACGPISLRSPRWPFDQTRYYEPTMGRHLVKELVAFDELIDRARIVEIKLATNELERQLADGSRWSESRPVNVDPGYLSADKFVLATTKDYSHRIYLGRGIYAEVTLHYTSGTFEPWPWTYPDYRTDGYRAFLSEVRQTYLSRLTAS